VTSQRNDRCENKFGAKYRQAKRRRILSPVIEAKSLLFTSRAEMRISLRTDFPGLSKPQPFKLRFLKWPFIPLECGNLTEIAFNTE
jgi:hypothetical protein